VREPWATSTTVVDYYEKQLSNSTFKIQGEEESFALEQVLEKTFHKDQEVRQKALRAVNAGLKDNGIDRFASLSLNMVAGSWHIERMERKYKNLRSSRNLFNDVPDEVVDSLLRVVRQDGVNLAKRYYSIKKAILKKTSNIQTFTWADRNAPIDFGKDQEVYSWDSAVKIVDAGFKKFSPKMAELFMQMVKEERLDAPVVAGKRSGAYCHGVVPGIGPFQFHNFMGSKRDVATLAHESGHGCHDILAYHQGMLQYHPPLILAETASIFGEMIVFRDLLEKTSVKAERLSMIMSKIDDVVNSVIRQCSFDRFEELVHDARKDGQVSDDEFNTMWMKATREYYGDEGEVFDHYEDMSYLWSYVSHFHAVPFYVYSYAFADLVVGSLYKVYQSTPDGFEDKLLALLAAGGSKDFVTVLRPFGLDPSKEQFWVDSIKAHLGSLVEEAEALAVELTFLDAPTPTCSK